MIGIRQNQLFVFLCTTFFLINSSTSFGQACTASASNAAGDEITFNGVTYNETANGCTSTWSYCLKAGPGNPEISHFMIGNDSCLECFDSENDILDSSHPIEVGTDPTTGKCGVKFDFGLSVNEEVCFSFTLNGAFETANMLFVTKAGQNVHTTSICGPVCSEKICESNNPPPPPAGNPEGENPPPTDNNCPGIAYNDAGDEIIFLGVNYNSNGNLCTSTWNYCLKAGPGNPEISHFNIASPNCLSCLDSEDDILEASHPFEIGTDPTTGQCGIKFDFGLSVNEEICFSFTLKGAFAVSEQLFVTKAGQNVHTVAICGPECTEISCEGNVPKEELNCVDVLSHRAVKNTFDHCGNWCDSYVFTLGSGNCYQAGDDLYYTEYADGTATLTGSVIQGSSIGYLDVLFTGRTDQAPAGSPKYMLCVDDGGEFWHYYPEFTGTFTYPNGNSTTFTRRGPAFQVGYGANVQDFDYGASGWFDCSNGDQGDMNFQLGDPEVCEPTEIYLEAECADVGSLFVSGEDANASNGDYVTVAPSNNAYNAAPESAESRVRFHLDLTAAGPYFLFARVKTPTTTDDSFWVRVNEGHWVRWNEIPVSDTFTWAQVHDNSNNNTPVSFFLSAGPNTIDFAYREDGALLDKIFIGQSENAPTDMGIEASNCACVDDIMLTCTPTNENCDGNSIPGIHLEISGATSTVSYLWSNGATSQHLENIVAGTYTVTVTTQNGCSATCSSTVTEHAPLAIQCYASNAMCTDNGSTQPTGSVTVQAEGGTAPFSYQWSNGSTNATIDGVAPGTYTVTVSDANGCSQSCSATVETEATFTMFCSVLNDYCNGNQNAVIYVEHTSDPSALSYLWSNGSSEPYLSGVGPGTYGVTVTHNISGCSKTCSATIDAIEPLSIECVATNTTCGTTNDGTVTVYLTGGTEPYTIHWENGNCTDFAEGLEAGEYPIMVTDANGCEVNCTAVVEPSETLSVSCISHPGNCNSNYNSITTEVIGGSGVYTYEWSNGSTNPNLYNTSPGAYSVTVTDEDGCFGICETSVETYTPIQIICSSTNSSCGATNGTAETQASGGTAPYTYAWSNGESSANLMYLSAGTYSLTVTDADGCTTTCETVIEENNAPEITCTANNSECGMENGAIYTDVNFGTAPFSYIWSNGVTSAHLINLSAGSYTLTVTDANGCQASCSAIIESSPSINVSCHAQSNSCEGTDNATISSSISGGTGPFHYLWSNGATTSVLQNVASGVYSLTVTDSKGCEATCETEINNSPALTISCSFVDFVCGAPNFANLISEANGGDGNYSFTWSNGETTQNLEYVPAGVYTVTVTDGQACSAICEVEIPNTEQLIVECNTQNQICDGGNNNIISAIASGGTGLYSYQWSNGSTESSLPNVDAGTYTVTVTDELGCLASCEAVIEVYPALTAVCEANDLDCTGENTGSVSVSVQGGLAPYVYQWSNGETTATLSDLPSGTYGVTVTDANACTTTCSATVTEAEPIIVISSSTPLECYGDSTSTADFTITGGTAPYTYVWDNGSTDAIIYDLPAGFYGITVTDANGCTGICGTWVEGPEAIEVLFEKTSVSCFGSNDGSITSIVTGGTGAYSFLWSNNSTTQNLNNLAAGEYTLTVSDENGCTQTFATTIESSPSLEATCTPTPLSCPEANDGNILVAVSGGTGTYSYAWSNGATTQHLLNAAAGTYSLTITDENECTTICSSTIEAPTPLSLSCVANDLVCAGPETGSITTQVAGGTTPYTYQWDNGATTANLENLNTGTYTLTVSDANGCTITCSSSVETSAPLTLSLEGQDLLCGESNSGIAAAIVDGGTTPYTYSWSNGATSAQINDLAEGTYDLTVTDQQGCSASASITINSIPPLQAFCSKQDLDCGEPNSGNISTTVIGGTAPYTYAWNNGATTKNLQGVAEGSYSLTVTDANGCTAICSSTLIFIEPMSLSCSASDLICATSGTGSIDLNISGGTAPYVFIWDNGSNSQNLDNLDAGIYTVTVLDANDCATVSSCEVRTDQPLELDCTVIGASCGDDHSGDIDVTVSGGVAPYSFLWSNGATTEDLIDIESGTYALTVTDAKGCSRTCTNVVETSIGLNLSVSTTGTQCGEEGTGSVDLTVTGGTGNYTFTWSDGSGTEDLTDVNSGAYSVTVSDSNGCSSTTTAVVDESASLEAVCEPNNIPCGGEQTGSVDVTVIGGTGPYGFQWSNGNVAEDLNGVPAGTYTVTITDSNGCQTICSSTVTESPAFTLSCISDAVSCRNSNDGAIDVSINGGTEPFTYAWSNGATTQNLSNLAAGTYIITATDANGCTATCTSVVTEPAALLVIPQANNISCNGQADGSAFATVIGGTVPYSYAWSTGATTSFINALVEGSYTLTVTDANGCSNFGAVTITEPEVLGVSCSASPQDCQTLVGSLSTAVSGGTTPYSYAWSNGATTAEIDDALPGDYTVTVTDASGCTAICSATVAPANPIELTCAATNESCGAPSLGSVDLNVTGGTGPYFYQWSNGASTEDLIDVSAGSYTVTVTDALGCSSVCSSIVEPAPTLSLELISQDVNCNGAATGSIEVVVNQGLAPYSYLWNNGATTTSIENLTAGTYTVIVIDANGCSSTATTTITQPSKMLIVVSNNPVTCSGGQNGNAFASAIGGVAPYQFSWSNGMSTSFVNSLSAGSYTVTVTDSNGCSATGTTIVGEPEAITINLLATQLTCGSDTNGSITANITGGTGPLTYQWSTGETTTSIEGLGAGTYGLIVTDANGCSSSEFIEIDAANPILLECTASEVSCAGEADGAVQVSVSGGALPYSFSWANGATSQSLTALPAGTYTVTVTDANGCTATCTSIVNEPAPLVAEYGSTDVTCHGGNDGTLFAYPYGGTAPYNYEWSTGDVSETVENLPAGAYGLTLTDANGCIFICGIIINEPEAITCATEVNPAVSGTANLYDVIVNASGGTGNLSYSIDGGVNFQSSNLFADLTPGTYPIVIHDENSCISNCEVIINGGNGIVGSGDESTRMAVTPNPAAYETNLTFDTKHEGLTYIEVKNLDGKVLYTEEVIAIQGENSTMIDVSGFPNGTYFLVIYGPKGISSEQFTVLR